MRTRHRERKYKNNDDVIKYDFYKKNDNQENPNTDEIAWAVEDRLASQRESSYTDLHQYIKKYIWRTAQRLYVSTWDKFLYH